MIMLLFIHMVHGMGVLWFVLQFFRQTPDSASIFTAEIWAIIKALEEIKPSAASNYIVFTDSLSYLHALQSLGLVSLYETDDTFRLLLVLKWTVI